MKEIVYYRKINWKTPFVDFVSKLNNSLFAKVYYKIDLLSIDLLWINDIKCTNLVRCVESFHKIHYV